MAARCIKITIWQWFLSHEQPVAAVLRENTDTHRLYGKIIMHIGLPGM
jgi:hypothetical protein